MIALVGGLLLAIITRKTGEPRGDFIRRWAAFTWWIAAVEVLWFMAAEGYALVEIATRGSASSVIATLAGLAGEAIIVRGAWADFASGGILWILAAMLDELNIDVKQLRLLSARPPAGERKGRPARRKYCFVEWSHEEDKQA